MKLKIKFVGFEIKETEVDVNGQSYSEILESLGINPETVVVVRDNLPVPVDEKAEGGEIKVVRVISGG
ncbi:MAG: MoaD/ThiS family protein [Archaeoglobus sp.]|uniref:MoaD/ThiS family protein n=1 Tax=Archaeoglobus sp. TaxID=1872626 RepID=UPI001DDD9599|nr:MoaD/ThiS family protein [Archaeoglobus sp.]MBO8179269.1 MoaD/ThiS family protein [Archaeoglobus sp.]